MKEKRFKITFWLVPTVVAFITPSLIIFLLEVLVGGISPVDATKHILVRQFAPGDNLFLLALIGFVPFAILIGILLPVSRTLTGRRVYCVLVGGILGILGVMISGHVSIWYPLYGGGHMSSTAVVGFLLIPFFCIPTMLAGLALGWGVSLFPWFRKGNEQNIVNASE